MLDGVDPGHFEDYFFYTIENIGQNNPLIKTALGGHTLIALDGSEYFCSKRVSCPNCSKRLRNDGVEEYFHAFLAATIVDPNSRAVLSLPPEFITPQDGVKKQDCEWRAAERWLNRFADNCLKYNPVFLGDDLYAKHDMCKRLIDMGANFIFTCKDASHKTLCEFRAGLMAKSLEKEEGKGNQKRRYCYKWLCDLPLRDGLDAVHVNWIDLTISNPKGKETYHISFITNFVPNENNVEELARCGRARWKIENETFNVLKNNGYHLEHNFGHGKATLSSVLVTLNLLAFNIHNGCDICEVLWQKARKTAGARMRLFVLLWTLTMYIVYPTWNSLLNMIATGRHPPTP